MTSLVSKRYQLEFFYLTSFNYPNLPKDTIGMINQLAAKVGAATYQKTPTFHKKERPRRRRSQPQMITAADWEEMRNFKSTKLDKNETGIEKEIDDLRTLLNKLTQSNYREMCNNITKLLENILQNNASEEDLLKVGKSIFEIGSMNKFWSELYASLYKDLISTFPIMNSIYEKNFESFLTVFETIRYIDAEKDYDEFCRINKENENRRALSSFFVHLMKNNVIPVEKLLAIIQSLQSKFMELIVCENQKNEVEEIAENLVIIIRSGGDIFYNLEGITEFIEEIGTLDVKNYKSLTRKTIFKFLDLEDEM